MNHSYQEKELEQVYKMQTQPRYNHKVARNILLEAILELKRSIK